MTLLYSPSFFAPLVVIVMLMLIKLNLVVSVFVLCTIGYDSDADGRSR